MKWDAEDQSIELHLCKVTFLFRPVKTRTLEAIFKSRQIFLNNSFFWPMSKKKEKKKKMSTEMMHVISLRIKPWNN